MRFRYCNVNENEITFFPIKFGFWSFVFIKPHPYSFSSKSKINTDNLYHHETILLNALFSACWKNETETDPNLKWIISKPKILNIDPDVASMHHYRQSSALKKFYIDLIDGESPSLPKFFSCKVINYKVFAKFNML